VGLRKQRTQREKQSGQNWDHLLSLLKKLGGGGFGEGLKQQKKRRGGRREIKSPKKSYKVENKTRKLNELCPKGVPRGSSIGTAWGCCSGSKGTEKKEDKDFRG